MQLLCIIHGSGSLPGQLPIQSPGIKPWCGGMTWRVTHHCGAITGWAIREFAHSVAALGRLRYRLRFEERNVLKPVPQPPLEPELDLNKASGTKLFWGRPCHVDAQHGPKQEAGVQGGGTAPLVGSGAKPQKPAMICTYYNQLYNGKCYSCTQLSTLHFVINLLEPACDMLARGWPRAGTRN